MRFVPLVLVACAAGVLRAAPPTATAPESMSIKAGFKVELLYAVPRESQGSWVAMCVDPKGRLIVSDQHGSLYRLTPPPLEKTEPPQIEKINADIGEATGLLWAFDSLYVVVCKTDKYGSGLYRVTDSDGDDQLDKVELLRPLEGQGDHGPHQVMLTPDGKSLTVITGNHTKLTELAGSLVPQVWGEDQLLPRMWDPRGHARGVLAPGGCIYRVSPDGKSWTLASMGYRNQYDAAYDPRTGDLFTYDSDMEWDMNTPWYRPTRLCLATSGSDFGWRSGSGKFPAYYPDTLPPVLETGAGSPTAVAFGAGANFPQKYRDALFLADWSYGKLYAVHLSPDGASYRGEREEIMQGQPLPLTDIVVRPQDGAMYLTTGGRKVQSALYRLTHTEPGEDQPQLAEAQLPPEAKLRREVEAFHGRKDPAALDAVWPHLGHPDRFVRYAARVVLEHNEVARWADRALDEKQPQAALTALLALARCGDKGMQDQLLLALNRIDSSGFNEAQQLEAARVLGVCFIRMGAPDFIPAKMITAKLDGGFPAKSRALNAELSQLLCFLQAPSAAEKTLQLLAAAPSQEEQLEYVKNLRVLKNGWTMPHRKTYFTWFLKAASYRGGASFAGFVKQVREEAVANLTKAERAELQTLLDIVPKVKTPLQILGETLSERGFVKNWTVDELTAAAEKGLHGRNYERGRKLFAGVACIACHRFDGEGGAKGPDLTQSGGRFTPRDLLESIIDPNKVVSDQYAPVVITSSDGADVTGRIINLNNQELRVNTDMFDPSQLIVVDARKVTKIEPSKISLMPPGLLNSLKEDEVLDLLAYLLSRGDPNSAAFQ